MNADPRARAREEAGAYARIVDDIVIKVERVFL